MAQPAPPATPRAPLGRSMPAVVSPEKKVPKNGRRGCFLGAVSALRVPRPSLLRPSPHADALVRVRGAFSLIAAPSSDAMMRARPCPPSTRPQPSRSRARSPVSALFLALVLPRGGASVCAWAGSAPLPLSVYSSLLFSGTPLPNYRWAFCGSQDCCRAHLVETLRSQLGSGPAKWARGDLRSCSVCSK